MQITINTQDILGDETTIRDEVISQVVSSVSLMIRKEFKDEIVKRITSEVEAMVRDTVVEIANLSIDTEYTPVSEFGRKSEPTTIRKVIANRLQNECVFKNSNYASDRNAFSATVIKTVEDEMKKFKSEYMSLVNKQLVQQCLDEATLKLKAACGIK